MLWDKHKLKKYEESHIKWRIIFLLLWYISFFNSTEYMKKVCNHIKAIKVEQESNTKTNTLQCKKATQQIRTTQSAVTKQKNL